MFKLYYKTDNILFNFRKKMDKFIFTKDNFDIFLDQAKNGDNVSQLIMACYYINTIFPEDLEESNKWLNLSMNNGNNMAQIIKKNRMFCFTECCERLFDYLVEKNNGSDYEKAIGYYYLGLCYLRGKGTEKDDELAKKYFLMSWDYGNNVSGFFIYRLENGENAYNYLRLSAKSGVIISQHRYGLIHIGGLLNEKKQFKYINMAANSDTNNKQYKYNLAILYHRGIGINKNVEKAKQMYKELTFKGEYNAMYGMSKIFKEEGNYLQAFKYIKMASKSKIDSIMYNYSEYYLKGHGTVKNIPKAIKILTKCYENGYKQSLTFG